MWLHVCASECECVCKSQWLLNLICQQINGPSLSWPPLCARVNLFFSSQNISNFFFTSSASSISPAASFLFSVNFSTWPQREFRAVSVSKNNFVLAFLFISSGQRPANQSILLFALVEAEERRIPQRKYRIFHSSLGSLAWLLKSVLVT